MRTRKDATVELVRYRLVRKDGQEHSEITVWFRCPHCGKRHRAREICIIPPLIFSVVGYSLRCGDVRVPMPWAWVKKPERLQDHFESNICSALKGKGR